MRRYGRRNTEIVQTKITLLLHATIVRRRPHRHVLFEGCSGFHRNLGMVRLAKGTFASLMWFGSIRWRMMLWVLRPYLVTASVAHCAER